MKFKMTAASFLAFGLMQAAMAYDFSAADAGFAKRTHLAPANQSPANSFNRDVYLKTRKLYEDAVTQTTGDEKAYALSQIGRLDIFYANQFLDQTKATNKERKNVMQNCLNTTEALNPAKFPQRDLASKTSGTQSQYYYLQLACTALKANALPAIALPGQESRLSVALDLKNRLIPEALFANNSRQLKIEDFAESDRDTDFEGGGILRVIGGVLSNKSASIVQLFNPELANKLLEETFNASSHPAQEDLEADGDLFTANYRYRIEAYIEIANRGGASAAAKEEAKKQARETAEDARLAAEDIVGPDADDTYADLIPDTLAELARIDKLMANL